MIFTWKPKWQKTKKLFSYIMLRLNSWEEPDSKILQHQMEGGTNPPIYRHQCEGISNSLIYRNQMEEGTNSMALPPPIGIKHQLTKT
jgi:hypothetical protein